ncbi:MAG TPA: ABC transporter substrate-binding protein [Dehalococcoidia bacterium]|nr:ABC transporter substrate-binding protein [Dehalococcoidia bacterium]
MASYWDSVLTSRISRRRALAATGATAAGAALLAACGGGDDGGDSGGGTKDASGLLSTIEDTSKTAKPGGTFTFNNLRDPLHWDGQAQGQVQLNVFNGIAYSALVQNKPGYKQGSNWTEVEANLASSWEVSPDKLTITFKLRDGVKWHNIAPVNGRAFEASDVVASWNRYITHSTPNNKSVNSNAVNPAAPVVSFEAPDAKTVVMKLKEPSSYIFQRLATMITGEMGQIYPKEAGTGFDPKTTQIGTGAYMLDKFTPSVTIEFKRNPEYFNKANEAYFDRIHFPLITEYASTLAQFKSGALSTMQPAILAEDVLTSKKDVPTLGMYPYTAATNSVGNTLRFGWNPIGGKPSPFLDIRLRQAISMAMDRDTYIDTFGNVPKFTAASLAVNKYFYTSIGYLPGYTLDPRDKKTFGENAKYYDFNMTEAKALFAAAKSGYGGEFPDIPAGNVSTVFGAIYLNQVTVMSQWLRDLGLKVNDKVLDYNIDYLAKYVTQQGKFEGILYGIGAVTSPDPTDYWLWRIYSKTGPTSGQIGMGGTDGSKGDQSGDPTVDAMVEKAKAEFDPTKRTSIGADIQRYLAKQAYFVSQPGFADNFLMAQQAIGNFNVFQGDSRIAQLGVEGMLHLWSDPTKAGHKA